MSAQRWPCPRHATAERVRVDAQAVGSGGGSTGLRVAPCLHTPRREFEALVHALSGCPLSCDS